MSTYTAVQRAALSFAALDRISADWRHGINRERLSFTGFGWDPLTQLFGSTAAGLAKTHLGPGASAALGFAALNPADAEELRVAWVLLLTPADDT